MFAHSYSTRLSRTCYGGKLDDARELIIVNIHIILNSLFIMIDLTHGHACIAAVQIMLH